MYKRQDQEYQDAQDALMEDYLTQAGEIQARTLNFQLETIMGQYADELDPAMEDYISRIQEVIEKYKDLSLIHI